MFYLQKSCILPKECAELQSSFAFRSLDLSSYANLRGRRENKNIKIPESPQNFLEVSRSFV